MKFKQLFIFLAAAFTGCLQNPKQTFYHLVNSNFIKLVDTTAYKTGRLIQIPNDTSNNFNVDKICILIDPELNTSIEIDKSVLASVRMTDLKDYEKLVLNSTEVNINKIDLTKINNTGRFFLITSENNKEKMCKVVAGKVTFHKPYISQSKAIIVVSISESSKAGYTNAFLFRKQNGMWEKIKTIEIERW